jgi:hypothetical protein
MARTGRIENMRLVLRLRLDGKRASVAAYQATHKQDIKRTMVRLARTWLKDLQAAATTCMGCGREQTLRVCSSSVPS